MRTYGEALTGDGMPGALREVVARQGEHVRRTYELVKRLREEAGGVEGALRGLFAGKGRVAGFASV